jgi:hypothetical protein
VENDQRALNVIAGMRKAMKKGRHVNMAPKGYRNVRNKNNNPTIEPGKDAPLIKWAFEEVQRGLYNVMDLSAHQKGMGMYYYYHCINGCKERLVWVLMANLSSARDSKNSKASSTNRLAVFGSPSPSIYKATLATSSIAGSRIVTFLLPICQSFYRQVSFLLLMKVFWRELLSIRPSALDHHIPFLKAQRIFCFNGQCIHKHLFYPKNTKLLIQ